MENIANKIKALLAKAASTEHEGEATLYLAKAHELMDKYQVSVVSLEDDKVHETIAVVKNGSVRPDWDFSLMGAVARYYGCEGIQWHKVHEGKLRWLYIIVGRESARVTAIEMHRYLVATVRRLGRERKDSFKSADTAQRRIGRALEFRINEIVSSRRDGSESSTDAGKNALVTMDAVSAYMRENHTDLVPMRSARVLSSSTARAIAGSIGLDGQVNGASTRRLGNK